MSESTQYNMEGYNVRWH